MTQPNANSTDLDHREQHSERREPRLTPPAGNDTTAESCQARQRRIPESANRSAADHREAVFVHEVANSLQTIGLAVQLVQLTFEAKYAVEVGLDRVIKGALKDIDSLLALLREFRGQEPGDAPQRVAVDLGSIVEDVLTMQKLACKASDIVIEFERERDPLWVSVDVLKMRQVIINLCKNAREAMPQGGRLSLGLHRSGANVILDVSDSGAGVPTDIDCFKLFETSKPEGSGVGLALTHQIVTAHRGTIDYVSEPGCGTTFRVSLPSS